MGFTDSLRSFVVGLMIEGPAKKHTIPELASVLDASGTILAGRLSGVTNSANNIKVLRHIIGIERWGQSRLRVALGGPVLSDEYDNYQPAPDTDWSILISEFQTTRRETVAISRALETASVTNATQIPHNQFGDLSLRGWLHYLNFHANQEAKRIK